MNLDGIDVFVKVVQAGSFTGAAKLLNMPVTTVSGKVAQLEKRLGVTLIQRTTRKLNITDAGQTFFKRCEKALEEIFNGQSELETSKKEPEGTLKLTTTVDVAHSILPSIISGYLKKYPKMNIELVITNRTIDLLSEGIDLAIRIGNLKDSSLIARKFLDSSASLWASSSFIKKNGQPQNLKELSKFSNILFSQNDGKLKLQNSSGKTVTISDLTSQIMADDMETVKHFINLGSGIGILPDFLCLEEEKTGKLVRILSEWRWNKVQINFVYPNQKYVPPKIKSFIEWSIVYLKNQNT